MTKRFSLKTFLNSDNFIIFNIDIKLSEQFMIISLKKNTYQITKIDDHKTLKVIISNSGLTIKFTRISDGWMSMHQSLSDPMFPEDDVWQILKILDFLYILKNQLN
jgi:hypothetical protein